jgi:hypothetical protein
MWETEGKIDQGVTGHWIDVGHTGAVHQGQNLRLKRKMSWLKNQVTNWENHEQDYAQQRPDPAIQRHKRGMPNSKGKNAKYNFFIKIRQEYNWFTEVTALPLSFDWN